MTNERPSFPAEVQAAIGEYVYRLIDPRNGETFYVGKGKGDRVFNHVLGAPALDNYQTQLSEKLTRIREIQKAGFEVQHVIHRHGLDSATAFEVEAALMDAYPGLSNIAGGHGNYDRGAAHSKEIIERYSAEQAEIDVPAIEVIVSRSETEKGLYDATRYAWKLSAERANNANYAFAVTNGLIREVYKILEWKPATVENFPNLFDGSLSEGRFGFEGVEADDDVRKRYVRKKVPPRARGAANPIRYHNI